MRKQIPSLNDMQAQKEAEAAAAAPESITRAAARLASAFDLDSATARRLLAEAALALVLEEDGHAAARITSLRAQQAADRVEEQQR